MEQTWMWWAAGIIAYTAIALVTAFAYSKMPFVVTAEDMEDGKEGRYLQIFLCSITGVLWPTALPIWILATPVNFLLFPAEAGNSAKQ